MNDESAPGSCVHGYAAELGLKGDKEASWRWLSASLLSVVRRQTRRAHGWRTSTACRESSTWLARHTSRADRRPLDLYEVNTAEQNEKDSLTATDEDLKGHGHEQERREHGVVHEGRRLEDGAVFSP